MPVDASDRGRERGTDRSAGARTGARSGHAQPAGGSDLTDWRRALRVLVTGGAGYIGSHVARQLREAGHAVVVYDNLSTGHRRAVGDAELVAADLADRARLRATLAEGAFDAVLHFAGNIWVAESVADPAKYYANNTANALQLFELCARHGVPRVVFSSTAAVYGMPAEMPIPETTPLAPINPYGASKMMAERILMDIAAASGLTYTILRYFNVAGAEPLGRLGEATPDNTHLIKVACEAALGRRPGMRINGTDYPTPDGTCIRDYIHVEDLAAAHLDALRHLCAGGASTVLNCGYGRGFSVREVLDTVRRVTGIELPLTVGPRRPGDPPVLIADATRIREVLGWRPRYDDLEVIVRTAWVWEQRLAARLTAAE
jgi:UDP-glucose 4-epimerase